MPFHVLLSFSAEVVEYDAVAVQEEMLKAEEYFCPICGKSDYEDPAMVACDACDTWYHCICVVRSYLNIQISI